MTSYDWREDAVKSWELAISELRKRYLAERLPGETAAEWRKRVKCR